MILKLGDGAEIKATCNLFSKFQQLKYLQFNIQSSQTRTSFCLRKMFFKVIFCNRFSNNCLPNLKKARTVYFSFHPSTAKSMSLQKKKPEFNETLQAF